MRGRRAARRSGRGDPQGAASVSTEPVRSEWYQAVTSSNDAWASASVTGSSPPPASASTKPWNWPVYCVAVGAMSAQACSASSANADRRNSKFHGPAPGSYASDDDVIVTLSKCHTSCDDSLAAAERDVHRDECAVGGASDRDRAVLGLARR